MVDPNVPLSLNSQSSFQNILPLALYLVSNLMCCHLILQIDLRFSNLKFVWYNGTGFEDILAVVFLFFSC